MSKRIVIMKTFKLVDIAHHVLLFIDYIGHSLI